MPDPAGVLLDEAAVGFFASRRVGAAPQGRADAHRLQPFHRAEDEKACTEGSRQGGRRRDPLLDAVDGDQGVSDGTRLSIVMWASSGSVLPEGWRAG